MIKIIASQPVCPLGSGDNDDVDGSTGGGSRQPLTPVPESTRSEKWAIQLFLTSRPLLGRGKIRDLEYVAGISGGHGEKGKGGMLT